MSKKVGEEFVKSKIMQGTAMCYFRSTPFTEHGELNYNGWLTEEFFFARLFSTAGKSDDYYSRIIESIKTHTHKTILLIGNQGCGKTTFAHRLKYICSEACFKYFDFDQDTSHPHLSEYIERLSSFLHDLLCNPLNNRINSEFYNLYCTNKHLIESKINAQNNIGNFFEKFNKTFLIGNQNTISKEDFINEINNLFFNQILCLIILWYISKMIYEKQRIKPVVFCLDNLDVLVNQEIIELFFKEYFRFIRNIDGIINNIQNEYIRNNMINYNSLFSFILICRQHTWARVKQHYPHDNIAIHLSTLSLNITDAFDKSKILAQREKYIKENQQDFGEFSDRVSLARAILNDLDSTGRNSHNIYDLFNSDYRQCIITIEDIIKGNPELPKEYLIAKRSLPAGHQGVRGIIYKALFDKFKSDGILSKIGVLNVDQTHPLVSNARILLNYLNYKTYQSQSCVNFSQIVNDFSGIISKDDIDISLVEMFKLGYGSVWNELIAFNEINTEEINTCDNTEIMITLAGHEYLDFIATHFEYFNSRVTKKRLKTAALYSITSLEKSSRNGEQYSLGGNNFEYTYLFQETIVDVLTIVEQCCRNMKEFYNRYMKSRYSTKEQYLYSPYVFGDSNVLHGERIIHTHIRYIDNFRLHLLNNSTINKQSINKILVSFIGEYIRIGEQNPEVLTKKSTEQLFPAFKKMIKEIKDSNYTSSKPINVF